jgi:hypothetical protein
VPTGACPFHSPPDRGTVLPVDESTALTLLIAGPVLVSLAVYGVYLVIAVWLVRRRERDPNRPGPPPGWGEHGDRQG